MGNAIGGAIGSVVDNALGTDFTGAKAQGRALDAQGRARDQANAASEQAWKRQQQEMQPWKEKGLQAFGALVDGSFFQQDPGYQFRLNEGNKAINAAMSARGGANSGAALKELTRYGQDFASNEYQNAWNRQNAIANYGNQAAMALGNFAGGHSANLQNNAIGFGNAAAASELGKYQMRNQFGKDFMQTFGFDQGKKEGEGGGVNPGMISTVASMFSDERVKTNIEPIPQEDIKEMKQHLKAVYFDYIDSGFGVGKHAGILAQDLEKSRLGKLLVTEIDGVKAIDMKKVLSMFLATMAEA